MSNCGQLIFLGLITLGIKFLLLVFKTILIDKNKLKTKWALRVQKWYGLINIEFLIGLMDLLQLDFYLGIFIQLQNLELRSKLTIFNIAPACVILIITMFTKVYLFFVSTRIAIIRDERNNAELAY